MNILLILVGGVLLYLGGEWLVSSASRLARAFGISPMVIGLTVVAFGTSTPELAATLVSVVRGSPEVALGNVVGSNIANLGLILGLTALVYPLQSNRRFLRREVPLMVVAGLLVLPVTLDGVVGRLEGLVLVLLLGGYLLLCFKRKVVVGETEAAEEPVDAPTWRLIVGLIAGVVALVVGAQALIEGAVSLARALGVTERVIGLTLVAVGTSLPELASSLVAAFKRETDIILGNIVGSNIFNVLAILGLTSALRPVVVAFASVQLDLWTMFGFSVLVLVLMVFRRRLGRLRGGLLLSLYLAYVVFLYAV